MVFHWSLSDSKFPQVSRTLLGILSDVVVWRVSACPIISKSFIPFTDSLGISFNSNLIFLFHSFFSSLAWFMYLSLFSIPFNFTLWSVETAKFTIQMVLFFCWLSLGLVVWPWLGDRYGSQNPREICTSHSRGIIIIIIIIHSLELFTSAIADGFSLESEWQQVSSSLQDSS